MSIENLLSQNTHITNSIENMTESLNALRAKRSAILAELRTTTGASFVKDGKHYQIRTRGETTYLVSSDKPLGRPRKTT